MDRYWNICWNHGWLSWTWSSLWCQSDEYVFVKTWLNKPTASNQDKNWRWNVLYLLDYTIVHIFSVSNSPLYQLSTYYLQVTWNGYNFRLFIIMPEFILSTFFFILFSLNLTCYILKSCFLIYFKGNHIYNLGCGTNTDKAPKI